jgi:hypothetical protein
MNFLSELYFEFVKNYHLYYNMYTSCYINCPQPPYLFSISVCYSLCMNVCVCVCVLGRSACTGTEDRQGSICREFNIVCISYKID